MAAGLCNSWQQITVYELQQAFCGCDVIFARRPIIFAAHFGEQGEKKAASVERVDGGKSLQLVATNDFIQAPRGFLWL